MDPDLMPKKPRLHEFVWQTNNFKSLVLMNPGPHHVGQKHNNISQTEHNIEKIESFVMYEWTLPEKSQKVKN